MLRIIILFLTLLSVKWAHNQELIFHSGDTVKNVTSTIFYHIDDKAEFSIKSQGSSDFKKIDADFFSHDAVIHPLWFKFQLKNCTKNPLWLSLKNCAVLEATLYQLSPQKKVLVDSVFYSCKNTENEGFWPRLPLNNSEGNHLFYLKIKMAFPHLYNFQIGNELAIHKIQTKSSILSYVFLGGMLLIFLYNIGLLLYWRTRIYLIYCIYLFFITCSALYINDFPVVSYLIGPEITFNYSYVWISGFVVSSLLFAYYYLKIERFKIIRKIYLVELILMSIAIVLAIIFPLPEIINFVRIPPIIIFSTCLISGFFLAFKGELSARTYSIGWLFMITGVFISIATMNGIFPYSPLLQNMTIFGASMEVLVFSLGLAQIIQELKNDQISLNKKLTLSNERQRSLNASLDSFNYHVNHELKTVVNNMISLTKMAKKYSEKEEKKRTEDILERLERIGYNGRETISSFLSLSLTENHFLTNEIEQIDIRERLLSILKNHELDNKISIAFNELKFRTINMHPQIFESVFLNLLTNSIKYCAPENFPSVKIHAVLNKEFGLIRLSDNGIGIDLEAHALDVFAPFKRIPNHLGQEGNGVGLYTVEKLIHMVDGRVSIDSALGKGSQFNLYFPLNICS